MLNERQKSILDLLGRDRKIKVNELAERLDVSAVTIRQDLSFLEGEGLLKRVHGAAVLAQTDDLENRLGVNFELKQRIAARVAEQVQDGETILVESGSVNVLLARELAKKRVTLLTTNVYIARQFRKGDRMNTILLGGSYQPDSESLVGSMTRACINQVNIHKAFIGIDGFAIDTGFSSRDMFRAEISAYIVEKAREVYVVSDASKFGRTEMSRICGAGDIACLVTDQSLPALYRAHFEALGVELILA